MGLQPGNVLLDTGDEPKVIDFGMARLREDSALTEPGVVLGTPSYIAPEQAAGDTGRVGPLSGAPALRVGCTRWARFCTSA